MTFYDYVNYSRRQKVLSLSPSVKGKQDFVVMRLESRRRSVGIYCNFLLLSIRGLSVSM